MQFKAISIVRRVGATPCGLPFGADKTHRELPLIAANLPVLPQHYFCADDKKPDGKCVPFE